MADFSKATEVAIFDVIKALCGKREEPLYLARIADELFNTTGVKKSTRTVSAVIAKLVADKVIKVVYHRGVNKVDRLAALFRVVRGRAVSAADANTAHPCEPASFCDPATSCLEVNNPDQLPGTNEPNSLNVPKRVRKPRTLAQIIEDADRLAERVKRDAVAIADACLQQARAAMLVRWHIWRTRGGAYNQRLALALAAELRQRGVEPDMFW